MIAADHYTSERDGIASPPMDYVVADRIGVRFSGPGGGAGELSWGQRDIWATMRRLETALAMGGAKALAPGTTVSQVADELAYLVGRYPSMRTRLDAAADGHMRQIVAGSGDIELEVVDAGGEDAGRVAEAVCERYRDTPFDHETQWPVRMAAIRQGDVCTHMAVIMSHLALDGVGAMTMMREVTQRAAAPAGGAQPLEQAHWQASPAGQRQNEAAMRYWDGLLRAMPPPVLAPSSDVRQPRHWTGVLRSTAMSLALRTITARGGRDDAAVLLAVYALAFARVTGHTAVAVRPVVSNRFRPGLAETVSPISQHGLCLLDTRGGSFDELVTRTQRAAMTAYKHAYYDRTRLDEVIAQVIADRGPGFDIDFNINDRRFPSAAEPGVPPAARQIGDALAQTSFRWTRSQDEPSSQLFVKVDSVDDATELMVHVDSHILAPEHAEALTRAMEAVAVEAAAN